MNAITTAAAIIGFVNHQISDYQKLSYRQWKTFFLDDFAGNIKVSLQMRTQLALEYKNAAGVKGADLAARFNELNPEEQVLCLNSLQLYAYLNAGKNSDLLFNVRLEKLLPQYKAPQAEGNALIEKYLADFVVNKVTISRSYWIILLLMLMNFWAVQGVEQMLFYKSLPIEMGLIIFSVVFEVFSVAVFILARNAFIGEETSKRLRKFNLPNTKIALFGSGRNLMLLMLLFVFEVAVLPLCFQGTKMEVSPLFIGINLVLKSVLYLFIWFFGGYRVPTYAELQEAYNRRTIQEGGLKTALKRYESELNEFSSKMEGYMLESAFLGALAFSATVQIVSADNFDFNFAYKFPIRLVQGLMSLHIFSFDKFDQLKGLANTEVFNQLLSEQGLQVAVAIVSILCTLCFLVVIQSRVRLNHKINDSRRFISEAGQESSENPLHFNTLVMYNRSLKLQQDFYFMDFFRNLGVSFFFLVSFTAGLFFGVSVLSVLLLVGAAAVVYTNGKAISVKSTNIIEWLELNYYKHRAKVSPIFVVLALLAGVYKSFIDYNAGTEMLTWIYVALSVYFIAALYFTEEQQIKNQVGKSGYRNLSIGNIIRLYMAGIGYCFLFLTIAISVYSHDGETSLMITAVLFMFFGWGFVFLYALSIRVYIKEGKSEILGKALYMAAFVAIMYLLRESDYNSYLVLIVIVLLIGLLAKDRFKIHEYTNSFFTHIAMMTVMVVVGYLGDIEFSMLMNPEIKTTRKQLNKYYHKLDDLADDSAGGSPNNSPIFYATADSMLSGFDSASHQCYDDIIAKSAKPFVNYYAADTVGSPNAEAVKKKYLKQLRLIDAEVLNGKQLANTLDTIQLGKAHKFKLQTGVNYTVTF